jgi:hypothetical protein
MSRFITSLRHLLITSLMTTTLFIGTVAQADQLALPAADVTAPVITPNQPVNTIVAGQDHAITVKVTDNIAVKSVTLYYRDKGASDYQALTMRNLSDSDNYSVTLSASQLHVDGIEYYIQATDYAGNTLLHGYAFSPIVVSIQPPSSATDMAASEGDETPRPEIKTETSYKWWWIALGVVAVGALAGGGGGGGGDTTSTGSDEPTVVITAPVP